MTRSLIDIPAVDVLWILTAFNVLWLLMSAKITDVMDIFFYELGRLECLVFMVIAFEIQQT